MLKTLLAVQVSNGHVQLLVLSKTLLFCALTMTVYTSITATATAACSKVSDFLLLSVFFKMCHLANPRNAGNAYVHAYYLVNALLSTHLHYVMSACNRQQTT
jgi:hypothetical protein